MVNRVKNGTLILALCAATQMIVANPAKAETFGKWTNPSGSVHLEIYSCGESRCGRVVWASEKAKRDAKKGSSEPLVGMTILRNFKQDSKGGWRGKAFVPDIGKQFSGSATLMGSDKIRVKGCLLGKIGCKSQVWKRL